MLSAEFQKKRDELAFRSTRQALRDYLKRQEEKL